MANDKDLGEIRTSLKLEYQTSMRDLASDLIVGMPGQSLVWLVTQICLSLDDDRRGEILVAVRDTLGKE